MPNLNYHHLNYFRAIAREGSLSRAAERLHVSQSALSIQLKQLEARLGQVLFERRGRGLVLSEAGHIALEHADAIFQTGDELVSLLKTGRYARRETLRIGAVSTLSRNFQFELVRPLFERSDLDLVMRSGSLAELLSMLDAHALDVLLSNLPVPRDSATSHHSHVLAEIPVSLVGRKSRSRKKFRFPADLADTPLVLPSLQSSMRVAFDLLMDQAGIKPRILAEVDDMAMLRLMARESTGLTLVPPVVVQDELKAGILVERYAIPAIRERFYAITPTRRFPNALVRELVARRQAHATL